MRFAGSDGATLAGTLLLPIWSELEKVPGVVLVSGSGPTDRDGNNALVPDRIDLLKQIAELLAEAGIASLRYDKRGIGASTAKPHGSIAELERFFSWDNFVGDVVAAQAELVKHDEIKAYATALLGHSEGGLLVLAAAPAITKHPPHGMVLVATPGRKLADILRAQIGRGAPNLVAPAERAIAAIEATGHVPADLPRELGALFPPYAGPFLQRLLAFDPAQALAASRLPCLVLQGAADRAGRAHGGRPAPDRRARQARRAGRGGGHPRGQPQSQGGAVADRCRFRRTGRARRGGQAHELDEAVARC